MVPYRTLFFFFNWLISIRGLMMIHTILHRVTMGKNQATGSLSMKFDVKDLWVMPSQNSVFYQLISIRGLMRMHTVLHRITMRKISKICEKNYSLVVLFLDTDFHWLISIRGLMRIHKLLRAPDKTCVSDANFLIFLSKPYVVGSHVNCFNETIM